jgi:hypothetical protein
MATPTTHEIALYMQSRFSAELTGSVDKLQMPRFPLDLLEECNFAARLLVRAARNQSKWPFLPNFCKDSPNVNRSNELVNSRLHGGARPAEQTVPGNEWEAGAGDAPVISAAGARANISAVHNSGLGGANTTMVFAGSIGV